MQEIFGLVQQAARAAGVPDVEAMFGAGSSALTRFANNTIHQSVAERGRYISVRALIEGRTARANSNRFDPDSIRRVTQDAIALTRLQAPDRTFCPCLSSGLSRMSTGSSRPPPPPRPPAGPVPYETRSASWNRRH